MTTNEKIGECLRRLREDKGYSLEDVATRVGKARQTIHKYESGSISISVEVLKEILDVYGISWGKFLDDID